MIFYLSRSTKEDIKNLKKSLSLLDKHFNNRFNYPVIVFHEAFEKKLKEDIRKNTKSEINFARVDFKIPDFLADGEIPEILDFGTHKYSLGYRHMCRFFAGLVYSHPALREYEWYWRLDTDSFILDTIDYDVFSFMEENNFKYGYNYMLKEKEVLVHNLWETVSKYLDENKIQPTFLKKFTVKGIWDNSYYYNNFEISKLDFWRSKKYQSFFNYLDRTGGLYKYRWGDAPIHTLAVSTFIPADQVHSFEDISYKHRAFVNIPKFHRYLMCEPVHLIKKMMKKTLVYHIYEKTVKSPKNVSK